MPEEVKRRAEEEEEEKDEEEDEDESDEEEDEEDEDELDTAGEFRALYTDSKGCQERFMQLASAAERAGDANTATLYREIAGGFGSIISDMIATTGGAISNLEEHVGDDRESFLTEDDAQDYLKHYRAVLKLIDDVLDAAPSYANEQRDALQSLRRATLDRIEYTKELGDLEDEKSEGNSQHG